MIIELISDGLWQVLWIIIFGLSLVSYWAFRQLNYKKVELNQAEKKNNNELFFISMAGSIGLGNIFVVISGVQKYGAGTIVWLWVGALLGRYLKFWEIFLSLKCKQNSGDFTGGSEYIPWVIKGSQWLRFFFAIFLLFYCIESFQMISMVKITHGFFMNSSSSLLQGMNPQYILWIITGTICGGLYYCRKREAFISSSSILMKIFLWGYFSFLVFLGVKYYYHIPQVIKNIVYDFFSLDHWQHKLLVIGAGIRIAIYSNDIGVGYEGIMQKYANVEPVESKQIDYCYNIISSNIIDVMVCTTSGLLACFYQVIYQIPLSSLDSHGLVIKIFNLMIPVGGHFLLTLLIFCAAFTTVSTYLQAGYLLFENYFKKFNLLKKIPSGLFYVLSFGVFFLALSRDLESLFGLMGIAGGLLVLINCFTIFIYIKNRFITKNII
jgi:Na+/alanine symporter